MADFKYKGAEEDPDLQRAIDLVDLHYGVKVKHVQRPDMGLRQARINVNGLLEGLNNGRKAVSKRR